ncbi:hypothetical protein BGW80DRAFT_1333959 [Lactifluus volemus]|nr:hypothetical protein BGW80DRAFT_1333959 [Lactifluus volemus]
MVTTDTSRADLVISSSSFLGRQLSNKRAYLIAGSAARRRFFFGGSSSCSFSPLVSSIVTFVRLRGAFACAFFSCDTLTFLELLLGSARAPVRFFGEGQCILAIADRRFFCCGSGSSSRLFACSSESLSSSSLTACRTVFAAPRGCFVPLLLDRSFRGAAVVPVLSWATFR